MDVVVREVVLVEQLGQLIECLLMLVGDDSAKLEGQLRGGSVTSASDILHWSLLERFTDNLNLQQQHWAADKSQAAFVIQSFCQGRHQQPLAFPLGFLQYSVQMWCPVEAISTEAR
ncbi:TPA: hypothetical protein ACH3X3_004913 [Trebouxia sp. C0006]